MKQKNNFLLLIGSLIVLTFPSCDSVESNFPVNIPIKMELTVSGMSTSANATGTYCLEGTSTYDEYKNKIESIKYVKASYRTVNVTPQGLQGNIKITVKDQAGNVLFNQDILGVVIIDYKNSPYEITLSQNEINTINEYISSLGSNCFEATLLVDNISGGDPPYEVKGAIDILFEADVKP
jgi:hypothetical protein